MSCQGVEEGVVPCRITPLLLWWFDTIHFVRLWNASSNLTRRNVGLGRLVRICENGVGLLRCGVGIDVLRRLDEEACCATRSRRANWSRYARRGSSNWRQRCSWSLLCGAALFLLSWICDHVGSVTQEGAAMTEGGLKGERRSRGVDPKRPGPGWFIGVSLVHVPAP